MLEELRVDLLEPGLVKPGDEVVGAAGDLDQLRQRAHAVGRRVLRLEVLVELSLQAGDADLEELVEVGRADRQELAAAPAAGWRGRAPLRGLAR